MRAGEGRSYAMLATSCRERRAERWHTEARTGRAGSSRIEAGRAGDRVDGPTGPGSTDSPYARVGDRIQSGHVSSCPRRVPFEPSVTPLRLGRVQRIP